MGARRGMKHLQTVHVFHSFLAVLEELSIFRRHQNIPSLTLGSFSRDHCQVSSAVAKELLATAVQMRFESHLGGSCGAFGGLRCPPPLGEVGA